MLKIYNRQKQPVGVLQTSGYNTEVTDVAIYRRLNSEYRLTFQIPMTSPKYSLIEEEGLIECEGQLFVIKGRKRNRQGKARMVEVTCQHIMRRLMDIRIPYNMAIEEALGKDISYFLNIISTATGGVFTFQVMDVIPPKDVYKWGYSNCLKAFQDLVEIYDVEFIPDNYNIKIYSKINIDNGVQYRYSKNILNNEFETNTDTLVTRMTGLGKDSLTIINLPASYLTQEERDRLALIPGAIVDGLIKVPYLISQYAASWATPDNTYFDGEFENNDIDPSTIEGKVQLLEEIRKRLAQQEIPDIQVQVSVADLWKVDPGEIRPQIGETVYLVDQELELTNIMARVMELTEYPFDRSKHTQVTLANYLLQDENDIIADLNASKGQIDRLIFKEKLNTSAFETFAKQAIYDINNSKSEIIYDTRGIVLQSKTNALHQVIHTANGIVITTDGGQTAKTAITAQGIAAEYIVGILGDFAQVRANQIIVGPSGEKIGDNLISGAGRWNSRTTLITDSGIYTGTVTTDQLIAGSARISTALIESLEVGRNVIMGPNATISWNNITGVPGNIINPPYIQQTFIDATNIFSPNITGGVLTGSLIQTATTGRRIQLSGSELQSLNTNTKDGFTLDGNTGYLQWYSNGVNRGGIYKNFPDPNEQLVFYHNNWAGVRSDNRVDIQGQSINFGADNSSSITNFYNNVVFLGNITGLTTGSITGLETRLLSIESRLLDLENKAFVFARRVGNLAYFDSKNITSVDFVDVSG